MKLIESLQVGRRCDNHTRAIYGGRGLELWHEVAVPWNIFTPIMERADLYPGTLPNVKPEGATMCEMVPPFYGQGDVAVIRWEGPDALLQAFLYIRKNHPVKRSNHVH